MNQSADRNLLFGILALQMDIIGRDELIAALNAWMAEKDKPLSQFLLARKALTEAKRDLLDGLVQTHLEMESQTKVPASPAQPPDQAASDATDVGAAPDPAETPEFISVPGMRFQILRLHARGGLGEVFVARDSELNREVALKQIQHKHASGAVSRARFLLEAEVTGALEHPGIVPVYALGTYSDGRPYYAMRFIRGDSLKDAIAAFHKAQRDGQPAGETTLALRQLLGRFLDVCNAIEYAHSRGVLHRDLKPANIMVGQYGETLVVDWGLAKVLGGADSPLEQEASLRPVHSGEGTHTMAGVAVGTPVFMSPEQAAGRLDLIGPASDVYSLGATLYSLLTGQQPFTAKSAEEILKKVRNGEFASPRKVNARVSPALEAICLKAMALTPSARYASASLLARDIERWLGDEPVSVWREPWSVRAARWARRHKSLVAGTAVLLVTAVVSLAISTILISREQSRTEEQRGKAEANFQTAVKAVNEMLTEVAQEQLAYEPGMEKKRRALLASARTYYTEFLKQKSDDPFLRNETSQAYKRLGDISRLLGEYDPAQQAYHQAIVLFTGLAKDAPANLAHQADLAECYTNLGEVQRIISNTADADQAFRRALRIQEALAQAHRDQPGFRKALARTHYNLGILLKDMERPALAEKAFDEAVAILKHLTVEDPEKADYQQHLARAYLNLGPVLRATDRHKLAEEVYREAIRLQTALVAKVNHQPEYQHELAVTYINLGYLLESQKRYAEATTAYGKAFDRFDRLVVLFPGVPVYRQELAKTQNNRAIVLARVKNWKEADAAWQQSLSLFEQLAASAPDVPDYEGYVGMALGNLGWSALQQKDLASAEHHLQKGMDHVRLALKSNQRNPAHLQVLRDQHEYLADTLIQKGEHARAAKLATALAEIFPTRGKDAFRAADLLARCAGGAKADPTLASRYAEQAIALLRQANANGFQDFPRLKREPFLSLANRDDYKRLLVELKIQP